MILCKNIQIYSACIASVCSKPTFISVIVPAKYQVTNDNQSQSWVFPGDLTNKAPTERRGNVDPQVCQIRLNYSNKLTWKINHNMGRLVYSR